jgi:hypothetical protein
MVERNSTINYNPLPNDLRIIFVAFVKTTTAALCREAEGRDELFVSTRWTIARSIVNRLLLTQEHRLNAWRFKNFPAPTMWPDFD